MMSRMFAVAGVILTAFLGFIFLFYEQQVASDTIVDHAEKHVIEEVRQKVEPVFAKGIYVTAYTAQDPTRRQNIIDLINRTELNAVVIDIKDYTGYILYDRPDFDGVWLANAVMDDVKSIIDDFHAHGIYVIARQTVMQDPVYAKTHPSLAVQRVGGGIWSDYKGLSWVDPTQQEIWEYNVEIARHAIELGFDEINFDYVRFPSDGDLRVARYSRDFVSRADIMREFYAYMWDQLQDEPAYISFDLFGLTLDNKDFDLNIGQRMVDVVPHAHYISPMIYPSHYPSGYLGIDNPAGEPYRVISRTMSAGQQHFSSSTTALMRPWLQAFNIGAVYDAQKIRDQIRAVEEQDNVAGWFLWNARNVYTDAGLQIDESVIQ